MLREFHRGLLDISRQSSVATAQSVKCTLSEPDLDGGTAARQTAMEDTIEDSGRG